MGNNFVKLLIVEYGIIALAYGWQKDWARVLYFVGAIVLSFGVLNMR